MNIDDFNRIPAELKKCIPVQTKGRYSDTCSSLELKDLNNPEIAFKSIKNRLLDVNNWAHYATLTDADFILLNRHGYRLDRLAEEGDFMKVRFSKVQKIIDAQHDFVHVSSIMTIPNILGDAVVLQLQPAHNPARSGSEVDHFFTGDASNTLILYRTESEIILSVHGRNEQPNLKVSKITKKVRNVLFATLGVLAVSKVQWKTLSHGLLNYNEKLL